MASAKKDRTKVINYIAIRNPQAAARMDKLFKLAVAGLAKFPERGKRGKVSGTRELLVHESYRLVYEIENNTVWILALLHTARQWPPEYSQRSE